MVITKETIAKALFDTEYGELPEKAQRYIDSIPLYEVPFDAQDLSKVKIFLNWRIIRCACGLFEFAIRFVDMLDAQISRVHPPKKVEGHIERVNFKNLVDLAKEYYLITICCTDGAFVDEQSPICPKCGKKYLDALSIKLFQKK